MKNHLPQMIIGVLFTFIILSFLGCLQTPPPAEINGGIGKYPTSTRTDIPINITWWLTYPKGMEITHTGIHYGYFPHPGGIGFDVNPSDSGYQEVVAVSADRLGEGRDFQATLVPVDRGTLYFRAHAVLNGKNFWSDERSIVVE